MILTVTTTEGEHEFSLAVDHEIRSEDQTDVLVVIGDDDWQEGPQPLRFFNMAHVVDYGYKAYSEV